MNSEFTISTDQALLDFGFIYSYLSGESYWAKNISKDKLLKAIKNSTCFGIYKKELQVGFARVISDRASFAYICDVFVSEDYRAIGLAGRLMNEIMSFPDFQTLRRWTLATSDAHGLYEKHGFKSLAAPRNWMEILTPYQ